MTEELEKKLYEAANANAFNTDCGDLNTNRDIFIDGAKWMYKQFENVHGWTEGWFAKNENEYMRGFRFDKPVELPCDVYIKRKDG